MLVGYLKHCHLLLAATRHYMFPNITWYTKSQKTKGEEGEKAKKGGSHSGSNCVSWEIQCNSHGCVPELGVQSWEDDGILDRRVQNSAPAPLGYEGAKLHRKLADRSVAREKQLRCKWKALGIAQVADSSDRGCSRAINPLWPSRAAADFCRQGETWGPFPNPDAWALREDFPTTSPPSACHPSHPSWLLEKHSCSYIRPKRHLSFAPYLVEDLFMVVCAQNFVTKELFHLKMPLPSSVSCDGNKTRAHVL